MSGQIARLPNASDDDSIILVPPGEYRLAYRSHSLKQRFNRDCLELRFAIAEYGEYFDKPFTRFYVVQASSKRRSFTAKPHSAFVREYVNLFGKRPNFKAAPIEDFKKFFIVGRIATVTRDHQQKPLSKLLHYSTIRELIKREES